MFGISLTAFAIVVLFLSCGAAFMILFHSLIRGIMKHNKVVAYFILFLSFCAVIAFAVYGVDSEIKQKQQLQEALNSHKNMPVQFVVPNKGTKANSR